MNKGSLLHLFKKNRKPAPTNKIRYTLLIKVKPESLYKVKTGLKGLDGTLDVKQLDKCDYNVVDANVKVDMFTTEKEKENIDNFVRNWYNKNEIVTYAQLT